MRIHSITLKNIKAHRDRELHFVNGINVLSGINGAGKSTIFEAIGYALFGVDARDFVGNIERFITIGEKKGEISVTFETDAGETFRVFRSVGAGSKWLLAGKTGDTFEIEDHAGAAETEARIKELLGLDSGRSLADQFKLVIGPFQHEFLGPFVLKQPTKRQEAFDEILGIDAWRKTYKGTSTLQAAVKGKIEVLAVEIAGKEEQAAALPDREKELASLMAESKSLQQQVAALEKSLVDTQKQLDAFDAREKSVTAARAEIQVLDNRISDGKAKIAEQQKRVEEAEKALAIMEKSRKGKEAFEAAESALKSLREQDKLRRAIEKDITALDKDCSRLTQSLAHELREINQTDLQLAAEEARLNKDRQALSADENVTRQAARLPELRKEVEQLRSARGLLEGRRAGLLEGKDKLAAGVCPFFQEPCQNIAGRVPRDVFTARVEELDTESRAFTKRIAGLDSLLRIAEKAQQQLDSIQVRGQELDKQRKALGKRRDENSTRRQKLEHIRAQQAEAEEKAADRKKELEKYRNLDAEIPQVEKLRTEHQAARDAFVANRKDAEDLINRRESLKKMAGLFEDLQKSHAIKQQELARLATEYDSQRHTELRLAKEKLVADSAAGKQKMDGLGKDRLRLETEITRLNRIRDEITVKLAEKKILLAREELVRFLRTRIFNHVSAQLSERFREEISLRADTIYRNIAETDEELYWGDKYRIVLRDMRDGKLRERSDDQLSGGQIMSAVVALRLALLQTIGARIAFFDEPTSNLDAARRENLAHAFRAIDVGREEVTEHWYDQLFLISHDVAFTEVTDQVISLDHNEGDR